MADTKISNLTNYTPPLDADVIPIVDIANVTTKKITWANIKATLKTYFDTQYPTGSGTSTGSNTGDQTISDATISTTDITTNNVSTSKHGFAPKAPNDATKYLDGTGAFSVPPVTAPVSSIFLGSRLSDASSGAVTYAHGLGRTPKYCRITSTLFDVGGSGSVVLSEGGYDGTNNMSVWGIAAASAGQNSGIGVSGYDVNNSNGQTGVITWDATNITVTWTKVGTASSHTINLLFQVF